MKKLDCKGLNCPEPVLRTKAHLEQNSQDPFVVIVDNEASRENVLRFGRSRGCEVSAEAGEDGCFVVSLTPGEQSGKDQSFNADEYHCELSSTSNIVYVFPSDSMGSGSHELGWALLQTYVTTIGEISPLPTHLLLYNGGVKLTTTPGKALEALQELEEKGVTVWVCGTCLEFFKLEKERKVGSVTNMYDIMNTMAEAARVVSPY